MSIEVKAALDNEYKTKMSFLFDIKVFSMTIITVLRSVGVKEGLTSVQKELEENTL